MVGVSLVGLSGSFIKDSIKDTITSGLVGRAIASSSDLPPPEPIEKPEATTVLVGKVLDPVFLVFIHPAALYSHRSQPDMDFFS
jgi:hypothetical protein